MSDIVNGMLGQFGAEHWKCKHMMTLGSKGLTWRSLDHCKRI